MSQINQLSEEGTLSAGDQFPIWVTGNGATRRVSANDIAVFVQSEINANGGFITQYAAPNATAFAVQINPVVAGNSVFLPLMPTGTFATGAITLPSAASSQDGQEVLVNSTQIVTTLTVNYLNAANVLTTVVGAPTTIAANGFFRLRFDAVFKIYIRIG